VPGAGKIQQKNKRLENKSTNSGKNLTKMIFSAQFNQKTSPCTSSMQASFREKPAFSLLTNQYLRQTVPHWENRRTICIWETLFFKGFNLIYRFKSPINIASFPVDF